MTKITKGYKVTDSNMKCRDFQFELNKQYTQEGELKICSNGFHFCLKLSHCFNYYSFDKNNRVFEIETIGDFVAENDKSCSLNITLIRELTWSEVLLHANEGSDNTGYSNTGDWNTGNSNTGYRNTGDWNTGYRNTGYSNTGNSNTGYSNTGNSNTGYRNTGDWNTGYRNTGYSNTGDWNTGNSNTGYRNTGYRNTGNSNTGYSNTGDWNTGNSNTGYSNTGNRNTGAFCTIDAPFPLFNKESKWSEKDFLNSKAYSLMCNYVDTKLWVDESLMNNEEKENYPSYKTTGGYLKDIPFKEAFNNAWQNWNSESKKAFTSLPNFCPIVFEEITSVKL